MLLCDAGGYGYYYYCYCYCDCSTGVDSGGGWLTEATHSRRTLTGLVFGN